MPEHPTETDDAAGRAGEGLEMASFESLAHYGRPEAPAEDRLRTAWARLRLVFREEKSEPFIADATLHETVGRTLDGIAPPPACGPLVRELEHEFDQWTRSTSLSDRVRLFVLPPCDENSLLQGWADKHGLEVLGEPNREELLQATSSTNPFYGEGPITSALLGDGALVIPKLERWFLRHVDGLALVRALVQAIVASERRILVGCGSWTWEFLSKAIDLSLIAPDPKTFKPFDVFRLRYWFTQLASQDADHRYRFRFSSSGSAMILGMDGQSRTADEERNGESETIAYFERLAARSRGIPWVAWHLWRRGMRSREDEAPPLGDSASDDDLITLWVTALDESMLPGTHSPDELLLLQALLIHGQLTREELSHVLPGLHLVGVLQALAAAGFVEFVGEQVRCMSAAYPTIRTELQSAGFPMDAL